MTKLLRFQKINRPEKEIYIPDYTRHDNVRSEQVTGDLTVVNISGEDWNTDKKEDRKDNLIKQEFDVSDKNSGKD